MKQAGRVCNQRLHKRFIKTDIHSLKWILAYIIRRMSCLRCTSMTAYWLQNRWRLWKKVVKWTYEGEGDEYLVLR